MTIQTLKRTIPVLWWLLLLLGACSPVPAPDVLDPNAIPTFAVQTLNAQRTLVALSATATFTAQPPTATETQLPPTATLAPSRTPQPTETPIPTFTPLPSSTPSPEVTPSQLPTSSQGSGSSGGSGGSSGSGGQASVCNSAQLVKDLSIPSGTVISPGAIFSKVWRIKNTGTCTWNSKYTFVLTSGKAMGAKSNDLPENVSPGETVDIALNLTAPSKSGTYNAEYMLRTGDVRFGTGSQNKTPFSVSIEVEEEDANVVYDFATNYCAATWETDAGDLTCPGAEGAESGFVLRLANPSLESRHEDEPALWTNPRMGRDGEISGIFPAIPVKSGYHFLADIGCLAENPKCDVVFQLRYQIGDDKPKKLDSWQEVFDGKTTRIDVDLSSLAGESVSFILMVQTNGPFRDDAAFWLLPQIRK